MKLWVDDKTTAPQGYTWCKSVDRAKEAINFYKYKSDLGLIEKEIFISLGTTASSFKEFGGDYINLLIWLRDEGLVDDSFTFDIHSKNNLEAWDLKKIIKKNGWNYVGK